MLFKLKQADYYKIKSGKNYYAHVNLLRTL